MGGVIPIGYELKDRKLVIDTTEAEQVREIFRRYLEPGCVRQLKEHLDKAGVHTKIRTSRNQNISGGVHILAEGSAA